MSVAELALAFLIIVVAEGLLALPVLEVVLHIVEPGAEETLVVAVAVFAVRIPLILGARQEVDIARRGLVDALACALIGALLALEVLRQEIVLVALDTLRLTRGRHLGSAAVRRPDVHDAAPLVVRVLSVEIIALGALERVWV